MSMAEEAGIIREPGSAGKNKTGSWRTFRPIVTDKCIGCGKCTLCCPENAIVVKEVKGKKRAVIDLEHCKGCLICMGECTVQAIKKEVEK